MRSINSTLFRTFAPEGATAPLPQASVSPSQQADDGGAIVQAVPHLESGPIGRFAADLALTVKKLGGDSRVISAGGRFAQEIARSGIVHEQFDFEASGPLGLRGTGGGKLGGWLAKWDTRLVHTHGIGPAQRLRKIVSGRSIRHVASLYRLPNSDNGSDAGSKALMDADKVIVASKFIAQILSNGSPEHASKISVIPPGMAINAVHPSVVTAARLTRLVKQINIPTDAPIILFPAALQPNAGHDILMDVLESLDDAPWACILATIGPSHKRTKAALQARIERAGFQNRVRFVENCDDPATLYKLSAVVISSIMGNLAFDYAAAEAQSAGKLVLVPNSGASEHQVEAGEDGAIFEAGDAETLGLALRWALGLPADVKASIEHAATARAYKTYKREEVVKRVFALYDELLT